MTTDEALVIVMHREATDSEVAAVVAQLASHRADAHVFSGHGRTTIGAIGHDRAVGDTPWEAFPGVERAVAVVQPFRFVSRDFQGTDSVVDVGGVAVGGDSFAVIAGPCAVESRDQLFAAAAAVKKAGAAILRGDAYKPRTSPYSFQGIGRRGLELLAEARTEFEMPIVVEVVDPRQVDLVASCADMLRVGARSMTNFALLAELGHQPKPVMLKRGFTATVGEWLDAAEYVYKEGNHDVVLCERGIRTFESGTRNTLDISAVPAVSAQSHLPVVVDPSHSAGRRDLVPALAKAGLAVGAHGIMVDVHPAPETALVDGQQALPPGEFAELMDELRRMAAALRVDF